MKNHGKIRDLGRFSKFYKIVNNWSPGHIKLSQMSLKHKFQVFRKKIDHNSIFEKCLSLVKIDTENHEKMHIQYLKFYLKNAKVSSCSNIIGNFEKHVYIT